VDNPERYGPYLVYEQIGKGGMATVHRAEQRGPDGVKEVALKRLFPTLQRELVALFLDEARLLRYLKHPNIAATYDSGRVFGTYFIAMEYVHGPTLKQLVEHCGISVGAVPQAITLNLAAQLCDALDHAHNRCDEAGNPLHIIHRDVTPANIIVSRTGVLKLIDFGLAKARVTSEHTAVGVIKGKFGYVAPEYLGGKLDHRADLWAVGIIMYELLTSRRLFDGPDAFQTMMRVRELPIPRPSLANPKVTPELDEIVMTALERDPRRRWSSAAAMRDRIRAVIAQPGNSTDNKGVAEWVAWAFEQKRGRLPQLTPMMPMPIRTSRDIIEIAQYHPDNHEFIDETATKVEPPRRTFAWTMQNILWTAVAAVIVVLLLGSLVWKLVHHVHH
jgi:eukaryotic-like serine/threonine-protein kinase